MAKKVKRVFILGAGASIGHTKDQIPDIRGFFEAAKRLDISLGFEDLLAYRENAVGKELLGTDVEPDIEALMTNLEIEIEQTNQPWRISAKIQLLDLIRCVLVLPYVNSVDDLPIYYQNKFKLAKVDIGEYKDFSEQLQPQDTVITFNWDILLDDIFGRNKILSKTNTDPDLTTPDIKSQYHNFLADITEATWDRISCSPPYTKWEGNKGYYLKLHGSVDWFYCENEACRAAYKVYPLADPLVRPSCGECHEQMAGLIIPPILNKTYRKYPLIRKLWNIAKKEVSVADEIIIWGYKMPPTDFHASWLLRQARETPLKKLILINPSVVNPKTGKTNANFKRHFYDMFYDKSNHINLELYEYFEDYFTKKDIKSKYRSGATHDFEKEIMAQA